MDAFLVGLDVDEATREQLDSSYKAYHRDAFPKWENVASPTTYTISTSAPSTTYSAVQLASTT